MDEWRERGSGTRTRGGEALRSVWGQCGVSVRSVVWGKWCGVTVGVTGGNPTEGGK